MSFSFGVILPVLIHILPKKRHCTKLLAMHTWHDQQVQKWLKYIQCYLTGCTSFSDLPMQLLISSPKHHSHMGLVTKSKIWSCYHDWKMNPRTSCMELSVPYISVKHQPLVLLEASILTVFWTTKYHSRLWLVILEVPLFFKGWWRYSFLSSGVLVYSRGTSDFLWKGRVVTFHHDAINLSN